MLNITSDDFYFEENSILFSILDYLIKQQNVKKITKADVLQASKHYTKNIDLVSSIYDKVKDAGYIDTSNVETYKLEVKSASVKRKLLKRIKALDKDVRVSDGKDIMVLLEDMEKNISDFMKEVNIANTYKSLSQYAENFIEEKSQQDGFNGFTSSYEEYDKAIGGGFRLGSVNIVGGRPKNYKSTMAINIAVNLAVDYNIPVLYLDTEMSDNEQMSRILSKLSGVSFYDIDTGNFSKSSTKMQKVKSASKKFSASNLFYTDEVVGLDIYGICSIIKNWLYREVGIDENGHAKQKCLVIYDYLKMTTGEKISFSMKEFQVIGEKLSYLKDMAKKYRFAAFVPVQLNRSANEKIDDSVFAMSDRLAWFCDNISVIQFKPLGEILADGENVGNYKLKPVSVRFGPGMDEDDYINLHVYGDRSLITEGKTARKVKLLEQRRKIRNDVKNRKTKNESRRDFEYSEQ